MDGGRHECDEKDDHPNPLETTAHSRTTFCTCAVIANLFFQFFHGRINFVAVGDVDTPIIQAHDPRGRPVYWVGPAGPEQDAGKGTDFFAVRSGYVSVTPIQVDLTRHRALAPLADWLSAL